MIDRYMGAVLLFGSALTLAVDTADAEDSRPADDAIDQAVFGVVGAMTQGDMGQSANPFTVGYEDHPVVGFGYQFFPYSIGEVKLGLEAGLAGRFGGDASAEIWGGLVARYDGFVIADKVRISPAFTFGISHVTGTMEGREQDNEDSRKNGDASTLFYLGPEISLSSVDNPNREIFWRLHHRSGAWGTLGNMEGGSNANLLGVRYRF
ncbi:hypothetical protein J5J10_08220 [Ciceribacter sp. L1K23]|uniref:hypothetical protein n=1 Tax=Ciceribacter sp. L1K23 TaxID=2820276 RepID=UPI001B813B8F|nr:hypothetical protein [Ciceribacter sp. L1K23]MBR0555666.1 hypothetical protein [Ciceribacter sp. L1K23]